MYTRTHTHTVSYTHLWGPGHRMALHISSCISAPIPSEAFQTICSLCSRDEKQHSEKHVHRLQLKTVTARLPVKTTCPTCLNIS